MKVSRVLLRLAAFFAAFVAAVSLVVLLRPASSLRHVLPARAVTPAFRLAADLDTRVEMVSLDREKERSYVRLRFSPRAGRRLPDTLRVRTYFFTSAGASRRVWAGDAAEVYNPFAGGESASVTVAAGCGWCADKDAPRDGYFARVQILTDREDSELPAGESFFDITTAAPVVVHVEKDSSARRE
ncbi:MAG: hypothetical protein LC800_03045 [Acidobacteria bacterium]|nr:hypothetical protein [Acidobacteriota bacterium]